MLCRASGWVVACVVLAGCEVAEGPSDSQKQVPIGDLANEIRQLRGAKETIEGWGWEAKWHSSNPRTGQIVYAHAIAKHNACVAWLISSLGKGIDRNELSRLIQEEDAARETMAKWCQANEPRQPRQSRLRGLLDRIRSRRGGEQVVKTCYPTVAAIGEIVGSLRGITEAILDYDARLKALEAQRKQEEIARIRGELGKCECRPWDALNQ